MKHSLWIILSVSALTLTGCGKKAEPVGETAETNVNLSVETPAALSAGQSFANAAASSDAFEIQTSRLAETNASSAAIKKFAAAMVKAHEDSTAKLQAAAGLATPVIAPDPTLTAAQQQLLDGMKAKSGTAFDAAYAEAQVDAHQKTLDTLRSYAASGDVPSLKDFAADLVPVVTGHLNMAKGLKG